MKKTIYTFLFLISFNINALAENCMSKLTYEILYPCNGPKCFYSKKDINTKLFIPEASEDDRLIFEFENSSDQNILINYVGILDKNEKIIVDSRPNKVINSYSGGRVFLNTQNKSFKYFSKYFFDCKFTKRTESKSASDSFSFKTILGKLKGIRVF